MADADTAGGGSAALQHALAQLHALQERAKGGAAPATASQPGPAQSSVPFPQQPGRIHVERSAEWVHASAGQLHQLLSTALPPLLSHHRPAVRTVLVQGRLGGCMANTRKLGVR
jgi:hypothetical protein